MSQNFFSFKIDVIEFLLAVPFADHDDVTDDSNFRNLPCIDGMLF
jgi:hypothetical protein